MTRCTWMDHFVAPLGAVQTPQDNAPLCDTLRRCRPFADPANQRVNLFRRRPRFFFRRHRAFLDLLQHLQPASAGALVGKVWRKFVDGEIPLGLFAAVAINTVLHEQRLDLLVELLRVQIPLFDCCRDGLLTSFAGRCSAACGPFTLVSFARPGAGTNSAAIENSSNSADREPIRTRRADSG